VIYQTIQRPLGKFSIYRGVFISKMSYRTGEILVSIGIFLFTVGNYYTVLCVEDLDKRVKNLRSDVQNLYRLNQYYRSRLSDLENKISPQEQSDEVVCRKEQ